ncbi:cytosolic phospholipase A2 zeta-like isoform X2 [Xyrichtys novacula]|uniref:Cytosolic phospholipase A2 zeta-like isoform X2 n=1 Tax=Xyrichtys novacula TaxID=13765 RepID=A0AAV1GSB7_XYRNO|nr:cytosolic phospholipase A2 zeta-like isoform X2 [Xyrichtys novacula]
MEEGQAASEKSVHESWRMCAGEQEYVQERKKIVLESLTSLGINCTEDSVPHIALLGSGGGERAAVSLVGSLYQMEKDGLLDSVLYLGGVSGSTWSMAFLYSDPEWSVGMDKATSRLIESEVELAEVLSWLGEKMKEEDFSLSDIWGVVTSAGIMKQMDLRHLSEDTRRNATNPYPIYCAIERNCYTDGPTAGKWFELSPHEAGFPELGLFVEASLLGSKFESGRLVENLLEMDMVQLQGVLGSAMADEGQVREYIPSHLNVPTSLLSAGGRYLHMYISFYKFVALIRRNIKDPRSLSDLDKLRQLLIETNRIHQGEFEGFQLKSFEEKKTLLQQWSMRQLALVETWSLGLEEGTFKTHVTFIIETVLPLIVQWEWGTTRNFLNNYDNSSAPLCLTSRETLNLVDAGLFNNIPYPSFLGEKRDIDLIIALEYSAGDMFETLTLARDYATEMTKPFPEIDEKVLEEKEWPKDLYVFEGKEKAPTIVYLPLFNRNNSKDADEVKERMEEYSTFQLPYTLEKATQLSEMAKENMKRNKETLLREISKAAQRRHDRQE